MLKVQAKKTRNFSPYLLSIDIRIRTDIRSFFQAKTDLRKYFLPTPIINAVHTFSQLLFINNYVYLAARLKTITGIELCCVK